MTQRYIAIVASKTGRSMYVGNAHVTRNLAAQEAFANRPKAKDCSTCIAFDPQALKVKHAKTGWTPSHRQVQWHRRGEL